MQFVSLDHDPHATPKSIEEKLEGIYVAAVAEVVGSVIVCCLPSARLVVRQCCGMMRRRERRSSAEDELELSPSKKDIAMKT